MMESDKDYREIMLHLLSVAREYDSDLYDRLSRYELLPDNNKVNLLNYLQITIHSLAEWNSSSYSKILSNFNEFVKIKGSNEINGIRVMLSPQEQELYGLEFVDLSKAPKRSKLINELEDLYIELGGDQNMLWSSNNGS